MPRVAAVCVLTVLAVTPAVAADHPEPMGEQALKIVAELSSEPRVQGTPGEVAAANEVKACFREFGYSPKVRKFSFTRKVRLDCSCATSDETTSGDARTDT